MKKLGLLTLIAFMLLSAACQKQEITTSNTNQNAVNSNEKTGVTSNQNKEQASVPQGIKAPEPCGYFKDSIKLKPEKYEADSIKKENYSCHQIKALVNYSGLAKRIERG